MIQYLSVIMEREEILRILLDWNYWGDYKDESIERQGYIKELNRLLKTGEIAVIEGVRRAGKSTLMLQFVKKARNLCTGKSYGRIEVERGFDNHREHEGAGEYQW